MLAASGCHKDSFDFDEFTRPTTTTPDDGTGLPTRTPNIGIFSPTAATQEGDAVVLMITSDADAPEGGLVVMISIGVATDGEFTANAPATCTTNLVCTVRILGGNRQVDLVLTPTSDSAVENSERWTASLVDGGDDYNLADRNNNVAFDITDPPTTPDPMPLVVGIATGDMPMEGGAGVTLTITSSETVPATLIGGLTVTIDITGADAADIQPNADCTAFPRCIVTIPAGSDSVSLILSPLSDFSTETESWTASLRDGSDFNLAAGGNDNVGFAITDLIAAVGIATGDMPIEDGAGVTLTISSTLPVPATLIGGLSVTINIVGADAADFNNAVCTNLVCIVTIPAGSNSVSLILSPLSDFSTETGERWTATLEDGDDYNLAAGGDDNVDFDITDLIAALGIATSNTAIIEGGAAVTLTITSSEAVPAALTDGLSVTINIVGADNTDFTSAACTNTQCVITIPIGMTAATLTIMASTDSDAEGGSEVWTATIAPDMFTVDSDADIAVANMLPPVVDGTMLMALNGYATPTALAADAIRNRQSDAIDGVAITASLYADASGNPQIYVQLLEFAALGIWVNGNDPEIGLTDHDYDYAFLGDNAIPASDLPTSGTATYVIEGDATYKGFNFFPDGNLQMDFGMNSYTGRLFVLGGQNLNSFGDANAMVPDADDLDGDGDTAELRTLAATDILQITLDGNITGDGFSSTPIVAATGFFLDLGSGAPATGNTFAGRFYDAAGYSSAAGDPSEIAGAGIIVDSDGTGDLHFGFLGRCNVNCAAGD